MKKDEPIITFIFHSPLVIDFRATSTVKEVHTSATQEGTFKQNTYLLQLAVLPKLPCAYELREKRLKIMALRGSSLPHVYHPVRHSIYLTA